MKGFGSVITGTTYSGRLDVEREIEVLPGELRSRARSIQVHGEPRDFASAGERTSVNLPDISLDQLRRGQQLVEPGALRPSHVITVRLDLLEDAKPLKEQTRVRFHHLSAELLGSVRFVDDTKGELKPGASAFAQIRLEAPVLAVAGDRFVIRRYSPSITIGGGVILDAHLAKLSRNTRREVLALLDLCSLVVKVELMPQLEGLRGPTIQVVRALPRLTREALRKELRDLPRLATIGEGRWIHRDVLTDFRRKAIEFLDDYFKKNRIAVSVPKSEFLQKLVPRHGDPAFLLSDLEREKIIAVAGDAIEVPGRSKSLGGSEGELARSIEERFAQSGLQPPPVSELINEKTHRPKMIEGVISFLVKQGTLVRIAEGVYLHRNVVASAKEKIGAKRGQTIDVGQFKDLFGISRKVAIPLLELFDREGVTKRVGDARQVL
jgi:selenocysteine-specific elongation factor